MVGRCGGVVRFDRGADHLSEVLETEKRLETGVGSREPGKCKP